MAKKGFVVKHWFEEVLQVDSDGLFKVRQGDLWGLYDTLAEKLLAPIECQFIGPTAGDIGGGLSLHQDGKVSFFKFATRSIFLSGCDEVVALNEKKPGLVKIRKNKKWQICDLKEGRIVSSTFDEIEPLLELPDQDNLFEVCLNDKWGIYDIEEEKIVMPVQFDEISDDDIARFKVRLGDKWGLFDTDLEAFVIDLEYEKISCVGGSDVYQVELGGKIGFIKLPG